MPNYDYWCAACDESEILSAPYAQRDEQLCSSCGEKTERQLSAPNFTKASLVDGQKRKGWQDFREASKLNKEAAGSSSQEIKKAITKEIRDKMKVDIQR